MSDNKNKKNEEEKKIVELSDDALDDVAGGAGRLGKNAPIQQTSDYQAPKAN